MTDNLKERLEEAKRRVEAMSPDEYSAMIDAQRKSWVRAMTTPCEHGWLDFEDCPGCREKARRRASGNEGERDGDAAVNSGDKGHG